MMSRGGVDEPSAAEAAGLAPADCSAARQEISAWPGVAPTPLVALPGLAAALGVAQLRLADEPVPLERPRVLLQQR